MGYKVVVVGATGNVGREMLNILAERQFPVDEIAVLASRKSLGTLCANQTNGKSAVVPTGCPCLGTCV